MIAKAAVDHKQRYPAPPEPLAACRWVTRVMQSAKHNQRVCGTRVKSTVSVKSAPQGSEKDAEAVTDLSGALGMGQEL